MTQERNADNFEKSARALRHKIVAVMSMATTVVLIALISLIGVSFGALVLLQLLIFVTESWTRLTGGGI